MITVFGITVRDKGLDINKVYQGGTRDHNVYALKLAVRIRNIAKCEER